MANYIQNGGVWIPIESIWVRHLGVWRLTNQQYIKDSDIWYNSVKPPFYFFNPTIFFGSTNSFNGDTIDQSFIVPSSISSITAELWGGGGAAGNSGDSQGGNGGGGGYVKATIPVTPGETLTIRVGGGSGNRGFSLLKSLMPSSPTGFLTDNFLIDRGGAGGGGGGYSGIFRGTTPLLIAGGGGGGSGGGNFTDVPFGNSTGGSGGPGGSNGVAGGTPPTTAFGKGLGGGGGTQSSGGAGGLNDISNNGGNPGTSGSYLLGGLGGNSSWTDKVSLPRQGGYAIGGKNGGGAGGSSRRNTSGVAQTISGVTIPAGTMYTSADCGGGGGAGYYGGGGGGCGAGGGGGGGGGGSNYVVSGATSVTNSTGSGITPGNTTSIYYITNLLFTSPAIPTNGSFLQGGLGYGGTAGPFDTDTNTTDTSDRGENGFVVIYW
jgi:hypothetical protein